MSGSTVYQDALGCRSFVKSFFVFVSFLFVSAADALKKLILSCKGSKENVEAQAQEVVR